MFEFNFFVFFAFENQFMCEWMSIIYSVLAFNTENWPQRKCLECKTWNDERKCSRLTRSLTTLCLRFNNILTALCWIMIEHKSPKISFIFLFIASVSFSIRVLTIDRWDLRPKSNEVYSKRTWALIFPHTHSTIGMDAANYRFEITNFHRHQTEDKIERETVKHERTACVFATFFFCFRCNFLAHSKITKYTKQVLDALTCRALSFDSCWDFRFVARFFSFAWNKQQDSKPRRSTGDKPNGAMATNERNKSKTQKTALTSCSDKFAYTRKSMFNTFASSSYSFLVFYFSEIPYSKTIAKTQIIDALCIKEKCWIRWVFLNSDRRDRSHVHTFRRFLFIFSTNNFRSAFQDESGRSACNVHSH